MSFIYDRNPSKMLEGIDNRLLDLLWVYEYKPTPKSRKSYLGVYDKDLAKYITKLGYKIHCHGYNRKADLNFTEFLVNDWDYWKVRKIIFKYVRMDKFKWWWEQELGEDYLDWVFLVQPPKDYWRKL